LYRQGKFSQKDLVKARDHFGIDPDTPNPARA
jgi:hypothetical protein